MRDQLIFWCTYFSTQNIAKKLQRFHLFFSSLHFNTHVTIVFRNIDISTWKKKRLAALFHSYITHNEFYFLSYPLKCKQYSFRKDENYWCRTGKEKKSIERELISGARKLIIGSDASLVATFFYSLSLRAINIMQ